MNKLGEKMVITTSWDDGHPSDLRIAELLSKNGLLGTFYPLPAAHHPTLSKAQLRSLSSQFELGAHTLDHTDLTEVSDMEVLHQAVGSKDWLEDLTGKPCQVFCFPRGRHFPRHLHLIRQAGFAGVRTVELLSTRFPVRREGLTVLPTTVQAFPHGRLTYLKNALKRRRIMTLWTVAARAAGMDWARMAEQLLKRVAEHGGVFHLWGHSWEIDSLQMWTQLDHVFRLAGEFKHSALFLKNSDLCLP
jgi:peptidoglycan-N-acetylglucosamine deacetylase